MRKFALLVGFLLCASPAWADSFTASWFIDDSGLKFQYTATVEEIGGNYKLTFVAKNVGANSGYFRGFGLKTIFDDTLATVGANWFSATLLPAGGSPMALTTFTGAVNQKTSNNDYCMDNGGGYVGGVCAELNVAGNRLLTSGSSLVFSFVAGGANLKLGGWHLQTKAFQNANGNAGVGLSQTAVPTRVPPTTVPEPSSMLLLALGFLAVLGGAGVGRMRTKAGVLVAAQ